MKCIANPFKKLEYYTRFAMNEITQTLWIGGRCKLWIMDTLKKADRLPFKVIKRTNEAG